MPSHHPPARAAALDALLLFLLLIPAWAPLTRPGLPQSLVGPLPLWRDPAASWPDLFLRGAAMAGLPGHLALKLSLAGATLMLGLGLFGWAGQMGGRRAGWLAAALALYTPLWLSALYRGGDPTPLWAAAGLALAGWGVVCRTRLRWLLPFLAAALLAGGGAGLLALGGVLMLALLARNWPAAALAVAGAAVTWLLLRPPLAPTPPPFAAAPLYQLLEPGWAFDLRSLGWDTPPAHSLGLPLLALLLLALWLHGGRGAWAAGDLASFLPPFLLGLLLLPFAPLLALPVLAVAAVAVLRRLPDLTRLPLFAALLILPLLAAGPGLSPDFTSAPAPWQPAARFGADQLLLVQAEIEGIPAPGATVRVTAHWLAVQPLDFDYNIFLHAVSPAGDKIAQLDVQPQAGARPMTTWRPGETISDRYELTLPAAAPPDVQLLLGVYNWQTLERLRVEDADAFVLQP